MKKTTKEKEIEMEKERLLAFLTDLEKLSARLNARKKFLRTWWPFITYFWISILLYILLFLAIKFVFDGTV
jgi:hypothetical protein